MSKFLRESLGLRDNESRLYIILSYASNLGFVLIDKEGLCKIVRDLIYVNIIIKNNC